ncbi:MAG: PIN domain-containing protein [Chloroflexota bacterium]|nr:PIN domain-containing protein [Chloroflexota bacterium]
MNVADMPGMHFLDTNILVYSFDRTAPAKQEMARDLIRNALKTQRGIISSQIVQEFLNVALWKFARPMNVSEARQYMNAVLMPLCQHYPSLAFYDLTLLIKEETGYSFYDSLVVTAAIESGCHTLVSEDMQSGRTIRGVTILDPFVLPARK